MPTLQQLTQALVANPTDLLLLEQGPETRAVTIETLLADTQPTLTLAPGALLGRVSGMAGGPEPVAIGPGLVIQNGTLSADTEQLAILASPILTGTPTAPTPDPGDNSSAIATTAFVLTQTELQTLTVTGDISGSGSDTLVLTLPAITAAGTYAKVSVNAKGQVTRGSTLALTDVANALGFTPYNATNPSGFTPAASLGVFYPAATVAWDGTHDVTAVVQAAINAAVAAGGGKVVLPAGKGLLSAGLVIAGPKVSLVGQGAGFSGYGSSTGNFDSVCATVLQWSGGNARAATMLTLTCSPAGVPFSGAEVSGFMLDCQAACGYAVKALSIWKNRLSINFCDPTVIGFLIDSAPAVIAAGWPGGNQHNQIDIDGTVSPPLTAVAVQFGAARGSSDLALNQFGNVRLNIRNGDGLVLGASDHNTFRNTVVWQAPQTTFPPPYGRGIVFQNSVVESYSAFSNYFDYVNTQGAAIVSEGLTDAVPPIVAGNNQGNGTISAPTFGLNAPPGIWTFLATSATTFTVTDSVNLNYASPRAARTLPSLTVGAPYSTGTYGLGLAITAGSIPFAAGDSFTVSVPFPATLNAIHFADRSNGTPLPTAGLGTSIFYTSDYNQAFTPQMISPVIGDAGTSVVNVANNTSGEAFSLAASGTNRHATLYAADMATWWGIGVDAATGTLSFNDDRALHGPGPLRFGTGGPVTIPGALTASGGATVGAAGGTTITMQGDVAAGIALMTVTPDSSGLNLSLGTGTPWNASLYVSNGAATYVQLIPNATPGACNPLVHSGDQAMIYTNGGLETGAMVIGAYSNHAYGLRLTASGAMAMAGTSWAFTGTVTVPTPAASDSSTSAATTAWVAGKGYVQQVATIAALRALAYAALADGAVMMVDAYATRGDGGMGLFVWNASATGADNSGTIVNPTGNSGNGRWLRQLPDGRVTPQMFGAKGDGATDDSAAFAAALAIGPVVVPSAKYVVSNVAVPNGAWMEGGGGLGYSGDIGTGTPGTSQKAAVVSPILLAKTGTTSCILDVNGCSDATLKGLFLDGVTTSCDGISSGSTQLMMERVTVVRCVNGLGATSTAGYTGLTDLYTHVATLINCEFANNTNGIANLIDTNMTAGAVSANVTGINLGSGANGNTFVGCRYEWNSQDGVQGYACASNVFVGGLFDRNSYRGVNLGAGCADFTFTGVQFNRNGASNAYPNNSHIALNGTTSVFFNGCVSKTGTNDNGTGSLTPAYFINYLNTNSLVTISGCDVSGFVTGFAFGTNPTSYVQRDNDGAGDTLVNAARPYISNGVACQTPWAKGSANIAPGATATIAMGASPFTNNYSVVSRELLMTATNNNSPYQTVAARFNLAFYRDTAVHAPSSSAAFGEAGGSGIVTWGGSGKLQLSASSVASDGSTWTLNILNGGTGDGSNWSVFAELH